MSTSAFFKRKEVNKVKDIIVSDEFVNEDGTIEKFRIRSISASEDRQIKKEVTYKNENGIEDIDQEAYRREVLIRCIVYPDLQDADLQDHYGVVGEIELLEAMLKSGEYNNLEYQIMDINGFNKTYADKVEEAKN